VRDRWADGGGEEGTGREMHKCDADDPTMCDHDECDARMR